METPGYSDRSDSEVSEPTAGGAETEDQPVQTPDTASEDQEQAEDQA